MKKLTSLLLTLFLSCSVSTLQAQEYALISELGASAKSIALGNINGFSDSATSIFNNPAALYKTHGYSVSFFSSSIMDEVNYYSICMSGETPIGKVGIGIYEANVLNIPQTQKDSSNEFYANSYFDYKNSVIKLSYQSELENETYIGASYSLYRHNYSDITATGIDLDLGLIRNFNNDISLSLFAQNIIPGQQVNYSNNESETLPFYLSSTLSVPFRELTFYPQLKYGQSMVLFSCGLEYNPSYLTFVGLLMGYKQQLDYTNERHQKLTFGLELRLAGVDIHYAYERSDYFLSDHNSYISLNYNL